MTSDSDDVGPGADRRPPPSAPPVRATAPRRVAVTGATGNVGVAVIARLLADPAIEAVVAIARRLPTRPDRDPRLRRVAADVATDDLTPHLSTADALVHLAWHFQPTHAPEVTWRANAVGSARTFEAAATAGVRVLVHASSVGAYSPVERGDDAPRDERWPTHGRPTSCYGREKAYAERALDAVEAAHPSMRVVRMRPAFIFGRHGATEQRRIFAGPFVPRRVARPGVLPVLPYPRGMRFQALHVTDVAEAYHAAITGPGRGAYNLAAGPLLRGEDLARILDTRLLEVPARVVRAGLAVAWHARLAPSEPGLLDLALDLPVLDSSRAGRDLGWVARRSATDAVAEMLGGIADGAGFATPPLAPDSRRARVRELASLVGGRDA